jgi:hypothetical protein
MVTVAVTPNSCPGISWSDGSWLRIISASGVNGCSHSWSPSDGVHHAYCDCMHRMACVPTPPGPLGPLKYGNTPDVSGLFVSARFHVTPSSAYALYSASDSGLSHSHTGLESCGRGHFHVDRAVDLEALRLFSLRTASPPACVMRHPTIALLCPIASSPTPPVTGSLPTVPDAPLRLTDSAQSRSAHITVRSLCTKRDGARSSPRPSSGAATALANTSLSGSSRPSCSHA